MNTNIMAKISIVGAGPGDPDLLTIKALKAIQSADVVLYDALVTDEILAFIPSTAKKKYVGKRAANHAYKQEDINLMMVQYAFSHGHVVRLKGGDPFVFGRGHEELQFAKSFDIPTQVVPGISSSIAVPELQEVPLTRRGINESFMVITATTRSGKLSEDIAIAAQSSATIVILMGVKKMPQIVEVFKAQGKSELPVMVTQNGSRPNEKNVLGTIADIHQKVLDADVGGPAVIVIGEVVSLHPQLNMIYSTAISKHK